VITGKFFFQEKNVMKKLSVACIIGLGIAVMNIGPLFSFLFSTSSKTTAAEKVH